MKYVGRELDFVHHELIGTLMFANCCDLTSDRLMEWRDHYPSLVLVHTSLEKRYHREEEKYIFWLKITRALEFETNTVI